MFTGIIETIGKVHAIETDGANKHFEIASPISSQLKPDQSVSHNGVCLTVTKVEADHHWVTAIRETLEKSNLGKVIPGGAFNLERCMLNNGRFDGHIVQGHVDQTGVVKSLKEADGSWLITIAYNPDSNNVLVEKGSVTVNGISLTCFAVTDNSFTVAIIPYTFQHTTMHQLKTGDTVNLEFDIIGKYVQRLLKR